MIITRASMLARIITSLVLVILLITTAVVAFVPVSPAEGLNHLGLSAEERNWEYINHNKFGTNFNPQDIINKDTVEFLELKWIYPIPSASQVGGDQLEGFGTAAEGSMAPPLIVDGVVYTILNRKTVIAIDAASGSVLWTADHPGASNDDNSIQSGGKYPMTPESTHTHGLNYIDGLLWFTDWGCGQTALDAETGERVREIVALCLEVPLDSPLGIGIPGNSGLYGSLQPHPPMIFKDANLIYYAQGGASEGTWGGRMYLSAHDLTTDALVWRTFLMPPCGDPTTCGPGLDGPLFVEEKAAWGQMLIDNCDKIWIQQIKACELDQDLLRNDWGDMRSNSGISNIWGQLAIDEETGIVYFGTAQPGPDWNATYAPGFRLFGSSVMALDARNGDLIWAHQTTARDLWDYDCSWNTILTDARVNGAIQKVVIKGCKNGIVYVLDAATGEAFHLLESPDIKRTPSAELLDPRSVADMTKPWQNYPSTEPVWQNCNAVGCLESDIAYDPDRNMVYVGTFNLPLWASFLPVETRGSFGLRFGLPAPFTPPQNYTINAFDVNTGEIVWKFFVPDFGFRGGVMASGGVIWFAGVDGFQYGLDADTGEILYSTNLGSPTAIQPTMGADADGKMKLFRVMGGRSIFGIGSDAPGALMAFGLPDVLPEPEIVEVIREVPGPERIVEVEVPGPERIVEVEVPGPERVVEVEVPVEVQVPGPERIVEVPVEIEVQTISPISYVAIGLGVVLIVISGVLFTRKRAT